MSLDVSLIERCNHCGQQKIVFEYNITHNLKEMARKAGVYDELWEPNSIEIIHAEALIKPLADGLESLLKLPHYFEQFNAKNGWGKREHLVEFLRSYLLACLKNPSSIIEVSS